MDIIVTVITFAFLAGLAMPLGAIIASIENLHSDWLENEFRHGVMAFGAGALLSAVALVLVPEGIEHLSVTMSAFFLIAGSIAFMAIDILLSKSRTQASQLLAMLSDFIPESLALGAAFATQSTTAYLLAALIALQNIPEGFNAYREIKNSSEIKTNILILVFVLIAFLGPITAIIGYLWLADMPQTVGAIMLFAAGGILYTLFQDIAPQVKLEKHYAPPLGAILGFVMGLIGYMMT